MLKRMIYGKLSGASQRLSPFEVLGLSDHLEEQEALLWRAGVNIEPFSDGTMSVGLFIAPPEASQADFIVARAELQRENPVYEYVALSRDDLALLRGEISVLLDLFRLPIQEFPQPAALPALPFDPQPWPADRRRSAAMALIDRSGVSGALALVAAAVSDRGLLVRGGGSATERIAVVEGLLALLPASARTELTFVIHTPHITAMVPRVVFCDSAGETPRYSADMQHGQYPAVVSAYTQFLARQSESLGLDALLTLIDRLDLPALVDGHTLDASLGDLVERYALDQAVRSGTEVTLDQIRDALASAPPNDRDLRRLYVSRLLEPALSNRDATLAALITREMDLDPALDAAIEQVLNERLESHPDEVYAFVRVRLNTGADGRWIERLQGAALASLNVAILDSDTETVVNWLKLVAREPGAYHLNDVLEAAILAARERAYTDGEIAKQLYLIAMRRAHNSLEALLADPALLAALPEDAFGLALRQHRPLALDALYQKKATEAYLVAVALATRAQSAEAIHVETVERVWGLLSAPLPLPETYQPMAIIEQWVSGGDAWMPVPALELLLTLLIADAEHQHDALFLKMSESLQEHPAQLLLLTNALKRSKRSALDVLDLTAQTLQPQQAVNLYVGLLTAWEWRKTALPIVEQVARLLQQASLLVISPDPLWRMLELGAEAKNDLIVRVAARRLCAVVEIVDDDAMLMGSLFRIHDALSWSPPARSALISWWRRFVRAQPLARLQRLDKGLESKRTLDDARDIVQTVIALRKLLGKRNWRDLARDVGTTYNVIEALSESFDPSPKHPVSFDPDTVREELDAHEAELETQERTVLANNLRELARLIATMGDNRSRASIVRRDLDRQLMIGEQRPQSAVDVLKWLAGYLGGAQDKEDEEDEK